MTTYNHQINLDDSDFIVLQRILRHVALGEKLLPGFDIGHAEKLLEKLDSAKSIMTSTSSHLWPEGTSFGTDGDGGLVPIPPNQTQRED